MRNKDFRTFLGKRTKRFFVFQLAHVFISVNIKSKNELDFFH